MKLLYRFFPNKEALLQEVYKDAIIGPFKAVWLPQLKDRSRPVEERLITFYEDYFANVLTRKWLRLFLYSSLAEEHMAPDYISDIIKGLMETIVEEVIHEQNHSLPRTAGHHLSCPRLLGRGSRHAARERKFRIRWFPYIISGYLSSIDDLVRMVLGLLATSLPWWCPVNGQTVA